MTRLEAIRRITKRGFSRRDFFNLSNFVSMLLSERKMEIKKRGRKLIKYLEVIKWVTLKNLQKRGSPTIGRMKRAKRTKAFFGFLEKRGKRMSRIAEAVISGAWGTQSLKTPWMMVQRGPGFSV